MMTKTKSKFLFFHSSDEALEAFLLFLLAIFFYVFCIEDFDSLRIPNAYVGRDLLRALGLLRGHAIWIGPEMTGGGNLPGPLYYYLIAVPLAISESYFSVIYFQFALAAAAAVVIWLLVKRLSTTTGAIAAFFIFLASPVLLGNLSVGWNPAISYIFLAALLFIFSRHEQLLYLFCGGLLIGLSLQIHLFTIIFLFSALLSAVFTKGSDSSYKLKKVLTILAGTLLPLLPFFFYCLANKSNLGMEAGGGYSWAAGEFFSRMAPASSLQDYLSSAKAALNYLSAEFLLFPFLILVCIAGRRFFKAQNFLFFSLVLSAAPLLAIVQNLGLARYLIPFVLMCAVTGGIVFSQTEQKKYYWPVLLLVAAIIFNFWYRLSLLPVPSFNFALHGIIELSSLVLLGCFLVFYIIDTRFNQVVFGILFTAIVFNTAYVKAFKAMPQMRNYSQIRMEEAVKLIRRIKSTTDWSYPEFRSKTYFQGIHPEDDYSFLYGSLLAQKSSDSQAEYDGALIHANFPSATALPVELENLISQGELICKKNVEIDIYKICFYAFKNPAQKPRLNNIGAVYEQWKAPFDVSASSGAKALGGNKVVFYWKKCRDTNSCAVFFEVTISGSIGSVQVTGLPLAVGSPPTHPMWALGLTDLQLVVTCKERSHRIPIVKKIGYHSTRRNFLAPYDMYFQAPCEKPDKILLALSKARSYVRGKTLDETPFSIEWERN